MDAVGGDQNGGFFGSFFASKNKKKMAAMEAPPPTLKASGTLSERENIEVEIISKWNKNLQLLASANAFRTSDQLILQHREEDNDWYGAQGYYA